MDVNLYFKKHWVLHQLFALNVNKELFYFFMLLDREDLAAQSDLSSSKSVNEFHAKVFNPFNSLFTHIFIFLLLMF